MQILIYTDNKPGIHAVTEKHKEQIKRTFPDAHILVSDTPTDEELLNTEILIPGSLSIIDFSRMPKLKWIHVTSAGVDRLPEAILTSDIIVTNSSGVHPIPISEHIFTYMLIFARSMQVTMRNQVKKQWDKNISTFELHGKTIGIIGMGRIGKETAKIAKGFGMKVLGVSKHNSPVENVDEMFMIDDLSKVLQDSDFVVNCLPGTEETRGLFDTSKFQQMKPSAYFISIGRGFSTVEKDLIQALEDGTIAGAGLDVFETEPLSIDSPLWEIENVILTPHTAGKTPYYMDRVIEIFCENMKAYLEKKPLPNLIDKKLGY